MTTGPTQQPRANTADPPGPDVPAVQTAGATPLTVDSQRLLQGQRSLIIAHQGESYRLQVTRQGKLILTK